MKFHKKYLFIIAARNQNFLVTGLAIIGLIAGYLALFAHNENFHEIEYQSNVILDTMLLKYDHSPKELNDSLNKQNVYLRPGQLDTLSKEINYRRQIADNLVDSQFEAMLINQQLFVDNNCFHDTILKELKVKDVFKRKNKPDSFTYTSAPITWDYYLSYSLFYGAPIQPVMLQSEIKSNVTYFKQNMEFFTEYPGFILWVVLIALQYSLFPVLTLMACVLIYNNREVFKVKYKHKRKQKRWLKLRFVLFPLAVILVYFYTSYHFFFRPNLITNQLFFDHMQGVLIVISVMTIAAGVACFTGFMLISQFPFGKSPNSNYVSDEEIEELNKLNDLFNNLLIISSIVLCLMVLGAGALYTAINKLEFIQKITCDIGYSPVANYFFLLIGVLLTFLFLIFFIPAKMRLMALDKSVRNMVLDDDRLEKPADIYDIAKSILVVALPIITGVLHYVFDKAANH